MHTNSLLTTAINLQKQPRDAHKFITDHYNQSSEIAQRCTQIHYWPLQWIFRNSPEMHTSSLPTTTINLQKLPRDAQKSPPKPVLGKFKGFSPITTWAKVAQGVHCKLCLRLDLRHTSALCYSLNLNISWLNVSASNIRMSFVKKLELCTCSGGRGKCHSHLALHCSSIYDLWPAYIVHGKMWWNWSLKTLLDSSVAY
jgi:hypothetical protein